MIIECSHCQARYQYDSARFEGRPSKKIRCAKCHEVFEIVNPEHAEAEPAASAAGSAAEPARRPPRPGAEDPHDMTVARGRKSYSGTPIDSPPVPEVESPPDSGWAALSIPMDRRYSLAITEGPDSATVFRIEKPRVTIGRSGADIPLNDPETSREHAAVEIRGNTILLADLGSTNGTFIDGRRLSEPVEIQNQQEFVVGTTTLMLIVTSAE